MKDNTAYFEGQVKKLSSMADHSWTLQVNIPEYAIQASVPKLMLMDKKVVKVLVTTENITEETVEVIESEEIQGPGKKLSPAQKLRNKLYGKWIAMDGDPTNFNKFYEEQIEYICSREDAEIQDIKNEQRD